MRFPITCDDLLHKKLKIFSVYTGKTLNALTVELYEKMISDWEKKHGEIKIPDSN
ncbi:MAG: hypothetical protein IJQ57_11960 [Synergistaceae bacterium]|nr:hypothetical protein [Synergistaceae bacterium]MBR0254054.1 hypothetical protein [Synergistaceae bacterium]